VNLLFFFFLRVQGSHIKNLKYLLQGISKETSWWLLSEVAQCTWMWKHHWYTMQFLIYHHYYFWILLSPCAGHEWI